MKQLDTPGHTGQVGWRQIYRQADRFTYNVFWPGSVAQPCPGLHDLRTEIERKQDRQK